jgi:xanthine dehydrogenase accessory factor
MKHWLETQQVLDELTTLRARGRKAALATVVGVRGSAYRRPGAKLLVAEGGETTGNVSGGCLEQDVREVALRVIASGRAERRCYCSGADPIDAWDLGVGCEGEVEIYIEPVNEPRTDLRQRLDGEFAFDYCTLLGISGYGPIAQEATSPGGRNGEGTRASTAEGLLFAGEGTAGTLGDGALDAAVARLVRELAPDAPAGLHEVDGKSVFVDRYRPPPRLLVFGAGDDARPLVRLALETGFRVTVIDRRPGLLAADRFPRQTRLVEASASLLEDRLPTGRDCYALLMTHSFADDRAYAAALSALPLRYLGILGPRARTERVLQGAATGPLAEDPGVYGPVGLDIGSEGAEQVAVSIVAELLAVRSGRTGGPLRDRCVPIHAAAE